MKKISVFVIIGGAALTALSFLFILGDNGFDAVGYILLTVGILLVIIGIAVLYRVASTPQKYKLADGVHYAKKKSIMSAAELEFFELLKRTVDLRKFDVLPQIALAAVIDKVSGGAFRNELFRIADFLIVTRRNYAPVTLVELNDASHKKDERRLRDEKVNAICSSAGLPVVTIDIQDAFNADYVKKALSRAI